MLKRIVFIWKQENIVEDMKGLLRELEEKHIEVAVESADCEENRVIRVGSENGNAENDSKTPEKGEAEETLFVTDTALWQKRLWEKKLPAIIYLHEGNREENFMLAEYAIEHGKPGKIPSH